jgi:hypothetical protein
LLPHLANRIAVPLRPLDAEIIDQLVAIALLENPTDSYGLVSDLLVNLYRNLLSSDQWSAPPDPHGRRLSTPSAMVSAALNQLATRLCSENHRRDFLIKIMRLFQQLSVQVSRTPPSQSRSAAKAGAPIPKPSSSVGGLLVTLATLFQRTDVAEIESDVVTYSVCSFSLSLSLSLSLCARILSY